MKALLLFQIILLTTGCYAQNHSIEQKALQKQYDKKITFGISIEPNIFFDVAGKNLNSFYETDGFRTHLVSRFNLRKQQYGGFDLSIGVAIKKRFHFNLLSGISGNESLAWIPLGSDVKIDLFSRKISPFIHFGCGYIYNIPGILNSNSYNMLTAGKGCFTLAGIGVSLKVAKALSIQISSDYRFLYDSYQYIYTGGTFDDIYSGPHGTSKLFCHQLGLRIALIFY